jgi:hypothetical protein
MKTPHYVKCLLWAVAPSMCFSLALGIGHSALLLVLLFALIALMPFSVVRPNVHDVMSLARTGPGGETRGYRIGLTMSRVEDSAIPVTSRVSDGIRLRVEPCLFSLRCMVAGRFQEAESTFPG